MKNIISTLALLTMVGFGADANVYYKKTIKTKKEKAQFKTLKDSDCWAALYQGENFTGNKIVVYGEIALTDLRNDPRFEWGNKIGSAKVGTKGKLELFGKKNLKDKDYELSKGATTADFRRVPKNDIIESMSLECSS